MVSNDDLLLETLAFQQPAAFRAIRVNVPEPQLGPEAFELKKSDTGGSAYLSHSADGQADRILLWEFTEEEPNVLRLNEVSQTHDLHGSALKLRFPSALHPAALLIQTSSSYNLVLLSSRGVLHALRVPHPFHVGPNASVLSEVLSPGTTPGGLNGISSVPLQGWTETLGAPTCLLDISGTIAIGGSSGAVVCIPQAAFGTGAPSGAFELSESRSMLTSFFVRQVNAPVADLASLGGSILVALYRDNVLRTWDVSAGKRLLAAGLLAEASGGNLAARLVRISKAAAGVSHRRVAVVFESSDGASDGSRSSQVAMYSLSLPSGLMSHSLEPVTNSPSKVDGSVDDVLLCHDGVWGHWAWVLHSGMDSRLSSITEEGVEGPSSILLAGQQSQQCSALQVALWQSVRQQTGGDASSDESAEHLLQRLVVPGELSAKALSIALADLGKPVAVKDIKGRSSSEILAFLLQVTAQMDMESGLEAAGKIIAAYHAARESLHPAYSLLPHPSTGRISVVRAGPELNPLRKASPAECMRHEALAQTPNASEQPDAVAADERVPRAGGLLTQLLSQPVVHAAMHGLWRRQPDYLTSVIPALLHSLTGLASLPGESSKAEWEVWRRRRRLLPLQIERLMSPIENLEEAVLEAVRDLEEPPLVPYGGQNLSAAASAAGLSAHRTAASARADVLHSFLLLISYLQSLPAIGTWTLPQAVLATVQRTIPQVEAALRQAATAEWLAASVSEQRDPVADSLELRRLDLGVAGGGGGIHHGGGPRPDARTPARSEKPLAALIWGGKPSRVSFDSLASAPSPGGDHVARLLEQVLEVATELLEAQQLDALANLLDLVGSSLDKSPAIKLLWGYATLGSLKKVSDPVIRESRQQQAVQSLFQAAAALGGNPGQALAAAAQPDPWLSRLLLLLERKTLGATSEGPPQAEQLRCYELLMAACEQLGCLEAGSRFAQAAVQQARQLQAQTLEGSVAQQLLGREARVWDNLFAYALGAGQYQEAYAALAANPEAGRQLQGLRLLIQSLSEARELKTLISLPFSSPVSKVAANGRVVTSTLLEEAIEILSRRAEHAHLTASPQPYLVLADFCAARSAWRQAAAAYLAYARRLQHESLEPLQSAMKISHLLAAASNALRLVGDGHGWLEDTLALPALPDPTAFPVQSDPSSVRERVPGQGLPGTITAAELANEAIAAAALQRCGLSCSNTQPAAALAALLAAGRHESAAALAEAALSGEARLTAMSQSLAGLATACALKQTGLRPPSSDLDFQGDNATWQRLRTIVERQPDDSAPLWVEVADAILRVDRSVQLPTWLLSLFLAGDKRRGMAGGPGDPAALLRVYLRFGKLAEAASLAQEYLQAWLHEVSDLDRQQAFGAWFPHAMLDTLEASLMNSGDVGLRARGSELASSRHQLKALTQQQARMLVAGRGGVQQASTDAVAFLPGVAA